MRSRVWMIVTGVVWLCTATGRRPIRQVYFTATQAQANGKPKRVKQAKMTLKRPKKAH